MTHDDIKAVLATIQVPGGGTLISRDLVRALTFEAGTVRFVIEAESPEAAQALAPVRAAAEKAVAALPEARSVSAVLTAHGPAAPKGPAPQLKIGGHPKPQAGPAAVPGVDRIVAVGSGKGGVGKSTVSVNLAVALAREGRRVGLLDADIYGPSVPRMLGEAARPGTPDGERIEPLHAYGVTFLSIGNMLDPAKPVIWRGPMLMGALQQMLNQTNWGGLDVLVIDLPPGTGDIQLSLAQRYPVTGAILVSTPQDVALIDARKALAMFQTLKVPVLGLIENMSFYICPSCGHEAHLFGHGGVAKEAEVLGLPLLAALPIDLDTRLGGDEGRPVAAGEGPIADGYRRLAQGLIKGGMG